MKTIIIRFSLLFFIIGCVIPNHILAQRQMENLDRGLVAVKVNNGVFLSWRVLGTDPKDIAFNIYRDNTKVNANPITGASNLSDGAGTNNSSYTVRPVVNGEEKAVGGTATVWGSQILTVNLDRPSNNHQPNDCSVGDLDGDGQYEIIVKWYPDNAKDNSQSGVTDNTYLDAYELDGTRLWRIDLGINIRSGAHYTQFLVGDYNLDGLAEIACKTAPGARDGSGAYISKGPAANDDDGADYRNSDGYVLSGPEYLTIFNGLTGEEMATVNYIVQRGSVGSWGDNYGNRLDRYNATNAYLDGVKPSMIFQRGYYTRMVIAAFDWDGQTLSNKWTFDSNNPGNGDAYENGNHGIMATDGDGDGFDEIYTGSTAIDHDGSFQWCTNHGHGDANHIGDLDPDRPGLEIWQVSENRGSQPDHYMIDARTGQVLWGTGSGNDNGRGMCGDIDANVRGQEGWSNSVSGTFSATGSRISTSKPSSTNFRVYWDGDLQDELLSGSSLDKWTGNGTTRLITLTGNSCNGSKSTPNLSADILGDWREEVILHDGASRLYIHTTTIPTTHKLYTLMHDPTYRNAISWQQSAYNQPPHLGFFLGDGVDKAPIPNIELVGAISRDCNGDENGNAFYDDCGTCVGGNTNSIACTGTIQIEDACTLDGTIDIDNNGFYGDGFANFNNAQDAALTIVLYADVAATTTLGIRYSNGGAVDRPLTLELNGTTQTLPFSPTGSWTSWNIENVTVNLNSGANLITLTSTTAEGGPNLDQFNLIASGIELGSCTIDCNGVFGGTALIDDCGTCVDGNTGKEACIQDCNGNWGGTAVLDECGTCVEGNTGKIACTTFQAEDACDFLGILETTNAGYSGSAYVNTDNEIGASIKIGINSTITQNADISIKYANGGADNRPGSVSVNGVVINQNLSFPSTEAWTTWTNTSTNIALKAGYNEVVFTATTVDGLPNIDVFSHNSSTLTFTECISTTQTINLTQGWNLISLNVTPESSTISNIFSGIDLLEIKTLEALWRKDNPDFLNSLQTLEAGKGYFVYLNSNATLTITGTPIDVTSFQYNLTATWNIIGCPYQTATPFSQDFNANNCIEIKNFEGLWTPNGNTNSIINMESGKGYFLRK
ncbi:MAG: carbohydrate-binding protein [Bacteroidales bacterium]|nr:carbohydrate-binding protein [Bacteroidales bacterium]